MKAFAPHLTDFYKTGHGPQYPKDTTQVYSNFTPRSGKIFERLYPNFDGRVLFVGLQGVLQWYLKDLWNEFFAMPEEQAVNKYQRRMDNALGAGVVDAKHIRKLHQLGYLPVRVKALKEGSLVDMRVPVYTITNTHPDFSWVTNYLESALSAETWKQINTATAAHQFKVLFDRFAVETGSPMEFTQWQGHDFSMRGQSGIYDAAQSGIGHMVPFLGTDGVGTLDYIEDYYFGEECFLGGSVPATEHAVACANIALYADEIMKEGFVGTASELSVEAERRYMKRLISEVHPKGIVSYVADTNNLWEVLTNIAPSLKDVILARQPDALGNAKVVFRPDSGDPVEIVCGLPYVTLTDLDGDSAKDFYYGVRNGNIPGDGCVQFEGEFYTYQFREYREYDHTLHCEAVELVSKLDPRVVKGAMRLLWEEFGGTVNEAGFKVLDQHVGLIYGDGIDYTRANAILSRLKAMGFASCNIVFGIGSFTYQYNTRDTLGMAMKATYAETQGLQLALSKNPITDSGTKRSAVGKLRVEIENGKYVLHELQSDAREEMGELMVVFEDGELYNMQSWSEVRANYERHVAGQI